MDQQGLALRNNNTAHAAVRDISLPAPTLYFGRRVNYCAWERVSPTTDAS